MPPSAITNAGLQSLFNAVDTDGSGDVSIEELTEFVWGVAQRADQVSKTTDSQSTTVGQRAKVKRAKRAKGTGEKGNNGSSTKAANQ
eukprot:COSAG02_NODE_5043_length_4701_cov_3.161886_1_plen_87_part_00